MDGHVIVKCLLSLMLQDIYQIRCNIMLNTRKRIVPCRYTTNNDSYFVGSAPL